MEVNPIARNVALLLLSLLLLRDKGMEFGRGREASWTEGSLMELGETVPSRYTDLERRSSSKLLLRQLATVS